MFALSLFNEYIIFFGEELKNFSPDPQVICYLTPTECLKYLVYGVLHMYVSPHDDLMT